MHKGNLHGDLKQTSIVFTNSVIIIFIYMLLVDTIRIPHPTPMYPSPIPKELSTSPSDLPDSIVWVCSPVMLPWDLCFCLAVYLWVPYITELIRYICPFHSVFTLLFCAEKFVLIHMLSILMLNHNPQCDDVFGS